MKLLPLKASLWLPHTSITLYCYIKQYYIAKIIYVLNGVGVGTCYMLCFGYVYIILDHSTLTCLLLILVHVKGTFPLHVRVNSAPASTSNSVLFG